METSTERTRVSQNMASLNMVAHGKSNFGEKVDLGGHPTEKKSLFYKNKTENLRTEPSIRETENDAIYETPFRQTGRGKLNGRTLSSFVESGTSIQFSEPKRDYARVGGDSRPNNFFNSEPVGRERERSLKFRATSPGIPYTFDLMINFVDPSEVSLDSTAASRTEYRSIPSQETPKVFEIAKKSAPRSHQPNQLRDSVSNQTLFDGSRLSVLTRAINSEEFASLPLEERYKKQEETIKLYSLFLKKQEKYIQSLLELNSQLSKSVTENIETVDFYIKKNRAKDDIITELEDQIRRLGGTVKSRYSQAVNLKPVLTDEYETAKKSFMTTRNIYENSQTPPKFFISAKNPQINYKTQDHDFPRKTLNFDYPDNNLNSAANGDNYGSRQDLDIKKHIERAEKSYYMLNGRVSDFKTRDSLYRTRESNAGLSSMGQRPWTSDDAPSNRDSAANREFI